jgi:peptidoglycan/LPS O-acetylase OafA/YrhL
MSLKQTGILDSGVWEDIKQDPVPSPYLRAKRSLSDLVRPSWLSKCGQRKQLRRTAYLDGLRGFAAFLVYWQHHQLWAHDSEERNKIFENGFGYNKKYYFATIPGIRLFFTGGHFAVTVFFVISGYVLSTKPLSYIQSGEQLKLHENLGSALFRRWIRLHIPLICTTFIYLSIWHVFGIWTDETEHRLTWRAEVWNWYCEFKNFSFVFRTGGEPILSYNFHAWSIPIEMRGSIVIYTALAAFSRCTRNARLWCEVGLIFYFMYIVDGWFCALFCSGMLLCDLDLLAASNSLPRFFSNFENFKELIFLNLFLLSIYFGGIPCSNIDVFTLRANPGWYYLSFLKPQAVWDYKWFFLFWASTFLVCSISRLSWLKSFFEIRFNQYLGRISFAFYLVHGPVLWMLGDRLYAATGFARDTHKEHLADWIGVFPMSIGGPLGLEMAFWVPHLVLLPVTLWLAEVVTKLFDETSVRFAAWLYEKTLEPVSLRD